MKHTSMDKINTIRFLAAKGLSLKAICKTVNCTYRTVKKYLSPEGFLPEPFSYKRGSKLDPYKQAIKDRLIHSSARKSRKNRLTATVIHRLVITGELSSDLEPLNVSIRSIQRLVREVKWEIDSDYKQQFTRLNHYPGEAQLDFGVVNVAWNGEEHKLNILVLTFPYSNMRFAHILPGQNFECLAHGLGEILRKIGRVPKVIRCDNMSTAVVKILHGKVRHDHRDIYDIHGHPRILNRNFSDLMSFYGFTAEFCNPASGHEKGSVENAVGFIRRNFFGEFPKFDGDYDNANRQLWNWCQKQAKAQHYRLQSPIATLFEEDMANMLELPEGQAPEHTWDKAVGRKDSRVQVDNNTYMADVGEGMTVLVKKTWNTLTFYDQNKKILSKHPRFYSTRHDSIDWPLVCKHLLERPMSYKHSDFRKLLAEETDSWITRLNADQKRVLFKAVKQLVMGGKAISDVSSALDDAVDRYGDQDVSCVALALRGLGEVPVNAQPILHLPSGLMTVTPEPLNFSRFSRFVL